MDRDFHTTMGAQYRVIDDSSKNTPSEVSGTKIRPEGMKVRMDKFTEGHKISDLVKIPGMFQGEGTYEKPPQLN